MIDDNNKAWAAWLFMMCWIASLGVAEMAWRNKVLQDRKQKGLDNDPRLHRRTR
jgi:uncharacterized protein (DUF608 family)